MTTAMQLGPDTDDGYQLRITRGFEDGTETFTSKFIKYDCRGVEDVAVQDPWESTDDKYCAIAVTFVNGETVHLYGTITGVQTDA